MENELSVEMYWRDTTLEQRNRRVGFVLESSGNILDMADFFGSSILSNRLLVHLGIFPEFDAHLVCVGNPNSNPPRPSCGNFMTRQNKPDTVLGWRYRCQATINDAGSRCGSYFNPMTNKFFGRSHVAAINPNEIVALLWCFCVDLNVTKASDILKMNETTVSKWYGYLREVMMDIIHIRWQQR